jgi:hypothetical protein
VFWLLGATVVNDFKCGLAQRLDAVHADCTVAYRHSCLAVWAGRYKILQNPLSLLLAGSPQSKD